MRAIKSDDWRWGQPAFHQRFALHDLAFAAPRRHRSAVEGVVPRLTVSCNAGLVTLASAFGFAALLSHQLRVFLSRGGNGHQTVGGDAAGVVGRMGRSRG